MYTQVSIRLMLMIGILLAAAAMSPRAGAANSVPFAVNLGPSGFVSGEYRITADDRVIVTEAWWREARPVAVQPGQIGGNAAEDTWHAIDLAAEDGPWQIFGRRMNEKRIVLLARGVSGVSLDDELLEPFVALMVPHLNGPAWQSFDAVTAEEALIEIELIQDDIAVAPDDPHAICVNTADDGEIVIWSPLTPNLVLVVVRYPDGTFRAVLYARDQYGCWYLRQPIDEDEIRNLARPVFRIIEEIP